MIFESYPWKKDLLKIADKLTARLKQKNWNSRSEYCFEKEIFISFYIIRKLIEANKISSDNIQLKIDTIIYPSNNKIVTFLNRHHTDELFRFDKVTNNKIELIHLCNQVIHSYIFHHVLDANKKICGLFLSSDRTRNRILYYLNLKNIIKILRKIGNDYPNIMYSKFDEKKGDFIIDQFMLRNENDKIKVIKIMHNKRLSPSASSMRSN